MSSKNKVKKSSKVLEGENNKDKMNDSDIRISECDNKNDETIQSVEDDNSQNVQKNISSDISSDSKMDFAKMLAEALKNSDVKQGFTSLIRSSIKPEFDKWIEPVHKKIEEIETVMEERHDNLTGKIYEIQCQEEGLVNKVQTLTEENVKLTKRVNEVARQQKARNLKIFGISTSSDGDRQTAFLAKFLKILKEVDISNIEEKDFSCFQFGIIPGDSKDQFVIVTMKDEQSKIKLYTQRSKLRNYSQKVFINEDLTKSDAVLYKKARENVKNKKLYACWTKGGQVFGKLSENGKPFIIDN